MLTQALGPRRHESVNGAVKCNYVACPGKEPEGDGLGGNDERTGPKEDVGENEPGGFKPGMLFFVQVYRTDK